MQMKYTAIVVRTTLFNRVCGEGSQDGNPTGKNAQVRKPIYAVPA